MARVGKRKIKIDNVKVTVNDNLVIINGKKGELTMNFDPNLISIQVEDDGIFVKRLNDSKDSNRLQGLYRALIQNMVTGVHDGFRKNLEIVGVGYKVALKGKDLQFALGYSHDVIFKAPDGIEFKVESPTKLSVEGIDKQLVGQVSANIKNLRSPDPYKGKGIRFSGEYIKTKPGKSVK